LLFDHTEYNNTNNIYHICGIIVIYSGVEDSMIAMTEKTSRSITIREEDKEVIESKALNLSKFVRNQLEKEFPNEYND